MIKSNCRAIFTFPFYLIMMMSVLFTGHHLNADVVITKGGPADQDLIDPIEITAQLRASLAKVKPACVGINAGASGVIISPDGYVITASHVIFSTKRKNKESITINLPDGRTIEGKMVGSDRSSDMVLLKMQDAEQDWPYVKLADHVPTGPAILFLYAHTGGYRQDTPPQLRLGRIRSRSLRGAETHFFLSDASVMPGDSGGPAFDIHGRLIGICTSAGPIGVNRYSAIDNLHRAIASMKAGNTWGDFADSKLDTTPQQLDKQTKALIYQEFQKRIRDQYPPVMDFIRRKAASGNRAEIRFADILGYIGNDAPILLHNQNIDYGIDAPNIIAKLPALDANAVLPLPIMDDNNIITYGIPVSRRHVLVKYSEIKDHQRLTLGPAEDRSHPMTLYGRDSEWDLALLSINDEFSLSPITWPEKTIEIEAGTGLMSPDTQGRLVWGIASDTKRPIKIPGYRGPMLDKTRVSAYRGPYPAVIRHNLKLYAKDAGRPVYTLDGNLMGVHMGRISRTLGLILDIHDIHESVTRILDAPQNRKAGNWGVPDDA